jgi:hypothetical protein
MREPYDASRVGFTVGEEADRVIPEELLPVVVGLDRSAHLLAASAPPTVTATTASRIGHALELSLRREPEPEPELAAEPQIDPAALVALRGSRLREDYWCPPGQGEGRERGHEQADVAADDDMMTPASREPASATHDKFGFAIESPLQDTPERYATLRRTLDRQRKMCRLRVTIISHDQGSGLAETVTYVLRYRC